MSTSVFDFIRNPLFGGTRIRLKSKVRNSELATLDGASSNIPPCRHNGIASFEACLEDPHASDWTVSRSRRLLDFCLAFLALVAFALPMIIIAACVRLTSKGRVLFSQQRVGRGGKLFWIYKFRSMAEACGKQSGPGLTKSGDQRVTYLGRYLRRFKLDELPQLMNVLRGDMSFVGPRPKLPQYAEIANLPCRPGITGAATIAFRHEEEILRGVDAERIEAFYQENIKPLKARLDVCYMCKATPSSDLRVVASTVLGFVMPQYIPSALTQDAETTGVGLPARPMIVPEQNPAAD